MGNCQHSSLQFCNSGAVDSELVTFEEEDLVGSVAHRQLILQIRSIDVKDMEEVQDNHRILPVFSRVNLNSCQQEEIIHAWQIETERKYQNELAKTKEASEDKAEEKIISTKDLIISLQLTIKEQHELRKLIARADTVLEELNISTKQLPFPWNPDRKSIADFKKIVPKGKGSVSYFRGAVTSNGLGSVGEQYYANGSYYNGEYSNNSYHGSGLLIHPSKDYYLGTWLNDQAHGEGLYSHYDGVTYQGSWQYDIQHGEGEEFWPDGAHFKGVFAKGEKTIGKFSWPNKTNYEGDFKNNLLEGKGRFEWEDGRYYYGQWKAGMMEGNGAFHWINGQVFEGTYQRDKKHGKGQLRLTEGTKIKGSWVQGRLEGKAIVQKDGKKTVTKWKNGVEFI